MRVTRATTALSLPALAGLAIGVNGGGAVATAAAWPWPSDLASAVAEQQIQRMFGQRSQPQEQQPQPALPPQQQQQQQQQQPDAVACLRSTLCSWEESALGGAVWYVKNPHRGDWCTNLRTSRRSGINNTKLNLVLQEGSCAHPKRVFYLKSREKRDVFPFSVRSVAHCRRC